MRILITGGAGFIASHVVDAYLADGHTVAVIDNLSTGKITNIPAGVELFEGDIEDSEFLQTTFAAFKPEIINHHAAQVSVAVSGREPVKDAQTNIIGTLNVLQAAKQAQVGRFIYVCSGGSMYGKPTTLPCTEEALANPLSPYALSKYTAEQYVRMLAGEMPFVILRYSNVYGPRQDPHGEAGVCAIFSQNMLQNLPVTIYGDGKHIRDYVYVTDLAAANVSALTMGQGQAFNIGTSIATTTQQVFEILAQAAGYALEPLHKPERLGEVKEVVLDITKASQGLKWQPQVQFAQGISQTVTWYKSL